MDKDTLKISQNEDGSFNVDWDKNDPEWKWLNKLSSKEIQLFIEDAIKYDKKNQPQKLFVRTVEGLD